MKEVVVKIGELPEKFAASMPWGLEFSPDGQRLAVGTDHYHVNIWSLRKKSVETTLIGPEGTNPGQSENQLQFSQFDQLFGVCVGRAAGDIFARVWNTKDWSVAKDIVNHGQGICQGLSFSPRDPRLIYVVDSADSDPGNVYILDTDNWQELLALKVPALFPEAVSVSPDGHWAAVSGRILVRPQGVTDQTEYLRQSRYVPHLVVIDIRNGKLVKSTETDASGAVAWSSDSTRIAVTGRQYTEVIDLSTGAILASGNEPDSAHTNVVFCPDSKCLIETDYNGRGNGFGVRIWDGAHQNILQHIAQEVGSIALSPDGRYVAMGMMGRTTIWQFK